MGRRARIYYTEADKALMWERWRQGESLNAIGRLFDRRHTTVQHMLARTGGIRPPPRRRSRLALTLAEREEISRGLMVGLSVRTIYFWPDLGGAMREFRRILRPGGRLVLGFLSDQDIGRAGLDRYGFERHPADAIEKALKETEFETLSLNSGSDTRGTYFSLVARRTSALATDKVLADRPIDN